MVADMSASLGPSKYNGTLTGPGDSVQTYHQLTGEIHSSADFDLARDKLAEAAQAKRATERCGAWAHLGGEGAKAG